MITNVWFCTTIAILLVTCHWWVTHRQSFITFLSICLEAAARHSNEIVHLHLFATPTLCEVNRRYAVQASDVRYIVDNGGKSCTLRSGFRTSRCGDFSYQTLNVHSTGGFRITAQLCTNCCVKQRSSAPCESVSCEFDL
jgi:hypothetical protein